MIYTHTPGPWYDVNYAGYIMLQIKDSYDDETDLLNEAKCAQAEANGRLCAAAPDLLNALERVSRSMQAHPDCTENSEFADFVDLAERVIAKAKGHDL